MVTNIFSEKQFRRINLDKHMPWQLAPSRSAQIHEVDFVEMIQGRIKVGMMIVFHSNVFVKGLFERFNLFRVFRLLENALLLPDLQDTLVLVPKIKVAHNYNKISQWLALRALEMIVKKLFDDFNLF